MNEMITLNIRIPKDTKEKLIVKAADVKRSTNNLISKVLQEFVDNEKSKDPVE